MMAQSTDVTDLIQPEVYVNNNIFDNHGNITDDNTDIVLDIPKETFTNRNRKWNERSRSKSFGEKTYEKDATIINLDSAEKPTNLSGLSSRRRHSLYPVNQMPNDGSLGQNDTESGTRLSASDMTISSISKSSENYSVIKSFTSKQKKKNITQNLRKNSKGNFIGNNMIKIADLKGILASHIGPIAPRLAHQVRLDFSESTERIVLTWENINVFTPPPPKRFRQQSSTVSSTGNPIITNVSGVAHPGNLMAIIGESGSGKTSLLNVLNQRNRGNLKVEGTVRVNGLKLGKALPRISGYVQQTDMMIGTLTVREHLWFHAMLRMDKEVPNTVRRDRVEEVILELSLKKSTDSYINGISGGERKRLAFASEVLTNPSLMFCDEPTSGLDTFMAENIVQTLKAMTAKGRTILCSIHQPSSETFAMFDRVLILADGRRAFLGTVTGALQFFKRCGYPCPINYNPADHYIYTLAVEPGLEAESRQRITEICEAFDQSTEAQEVNDAIKDTVDGCDESSVNDLDEFVDKSPYRASWWTQLRMLCHRNWLTSIRDVSVFRNKLAEAMIQAIFYGLIFYQTPINQASVINIGGILFLMQISMTLTYIFGHIMVFPLEFPIFAKEHHDGMYRVDTYFLGKSLSETPPLVLIPVLFTIIVYWTVGLYPSASAFIVCLITMILVCNAATSFGYMVSATSQNVDFSILLAAIIIVPEMAVGGLFLIPETVPSYVLWIKYLSHFTYANEILMVNQWSNIDHIACDRVMSANISNTTALHMCVSRGTDVLHNLGLSQENLALDFVMLVVLLIALRFIAFLFLYVRSQRRMHLIKYFH